MYFTEERAFENSGCELLELRRDPHKVDLDCISASGSHVLQNIKKMNLKILEMVSLKMLWYDVMVMLRYSRYSKHKQITETLGLRLAWILR